MCGVISDGGAEGHLRSRGDHDTHYGTWSGVTRTVHALCGIEFPRPRETLVARSYLASHRIRPRSARTVAARPPDRSERIGGPTPGTLVARPVTPTPPAAPDVG